MGVVRPERLELPAFRFVGTRNKTLGVTYGLGFELASEKSVVGRNGVGIASRSCCKVEAAARCAATLQCTMRRVPTSIRRTT
jgi:hypothetical protein